MDVAFIIIVIHFIADFIFQDEKWAVGKSKSFKLLLAHTLTYSYIWFCASVIFISSDDLPPSFYWFAPITFVFHTLTDYYTSKITSRLYAQGKFGSEVPNLGFFTMIGFDQVLHYAQLFLTYHLLNK